VSVATASRKDVPIYLEGLGTVTPIYQVLVKSQVDGRLDKVLFKEGEDVKKGDVLAQVDPRPFQIQLHAAQAALARDEANLKNAKLNLERYKTLAQQKLVAEQQFTDQQAMVDQLTATILTDQTLADTARLNLDYARVTSPIDGVTGVRQVDPGNIVHASDATGIVLITTLHPIAVLFTLPEDDLVRVAKYQAGGQLATEVRSRDGQTVLGEGKLALIDNQINQTTATLRLKSIVDNPQRLLWPGEFVKARLLLTMRKDAVVVPAPAVQRAAEGSFVYVVDPDNNAQKRPVDVESTQENLAIIARGVEPGEKVVVEGYNQIKPGSKVAPRPPPGSASAAPSASGSAAPAPPSSSAPDAVTSPSPKGSARRPSGEGPPP
jgi:multidrug efflux system membrane fusion protein